MAESLRKEHFLPYLLLYPALSQTKIAALVRRVHAASSLKEPVVSGQRHYGISTSDSS